MISAPKPIAHSLLYCVCVDTGDSNSFNNQVPCCLMLLALCNRTRVYQYQACMLGNHSEQSAVEALRRVKKGRGKVVSFFRATGNK